MNLFHQSKQQVQITELARTIKESPEEFPIVEMPVTDTFTPGIYARTIEMPKDSFVISEIHKTEHPFVITRGVVDVWTEETGIIRLTAPHFGITKPNTRRMLVIIEDCVWTTFHATEKTNVEEIRQDIILPFESLPQSQTEIDFIESKKLCHGQ